MTDTPTHHDLYSLEHKLRGEIHDVRRERYESEARLRSDHFRQEQWLISIALIIWSVALVAFVVALEARAA